MRTGEFNAFDLTFQAEMDNLVRLAYDCFERQVNYLLTREARLI